MHSNVYFSLIYLFQSFGSQSPKKTLSGFSQFGLQSEVTKQIGNSAKKKLDDRTKGFNKQKNFPTFFCCLRYGKARNKKRTICLATLLQNELNSDVTRFTTHVQTC